MKLRMKARRRLLSHSRSIYCPVYTSGVITILSLSVLVEHEDVVILQVDVRQKYPEVAFGENMVLIYAGPRTLKVTDPTLPPTEVYLKGIDGCRRWSVEASVGRYSVTMFFYRQPNENCRIFWNRLEE